MKPKYFLIPTNKIYMKHLIIILFFLLIIFPSCNRDKKSVLITDFSKVFIDSLKPYDSNFLNNYTTYYIRIIGNTNDSVKFRFVKSDSAVYFIHKGKINKKYSFDYYGYYPQYLYFDPYKATKGKLEIKYELH